MSTQSKAAFLKWAAKKFPQVSRRSNLGALTVVAADTGDKSAIEKAFDSVTTFLTSPGFLTGVTGAYQAKQLVDINIARAKQGLPPLDNATNPQVNVGLSNNVQLILWGGLALGAVYLFSRR